MPVNFEALLEAVTALCEHKQLKASVVGSLKGGFVTGLSVVAGGLFLGPLGLAIGGALGGLASAMASSDFVPVSKIIREMNPKQKQFLCSKLQQAFANVGIEDVATIAMMMSCNTNIQDIAIKEVQRFLSREMSLQIK